MGMNMKRFLLTALLCLALLPAATAQEPTDYGYYDPNTDGKTEISDVLSLLRDRLNANADISLLRVIRTLKAAADSTVISGTVTAAGTDTLTVPADDVA